MADEIIGRAEAQARGLKRYFTGKPCKHGHVAERIAVNGLCTTCAYEIEKRYKAAHPEKLKEKWRTEAQRHRRENPDRVTRNKKRWERDNKDKIYAKGKRWTEGNRDKRREYDKRAYHRDPERARSKNRKKYLLIKDTPEHRRKALERMRLWEERNPKRAKENRQRVRHTRRARMYQAGGSYTQAEIDALIEQQSWLCAEPTCCADLRAAKELDHIIAVSIGGPNHIRNLQYLCVPCNRSKRDKHPLVWAKERQRELTPKEIAIMSEVEHLEQAVKEAEAELAEAKRKLAHQEFPKFIEPHPSHIHMRGDVVSVPHFEHHIDRDGKVTVKVNDEEHEAKALAAHKEAK